MIISETTNAFLRLTYFLKETYCAHDSYFSYSGTVLEKFCSSSCLFKPPPPNTRSALIGQLTHAWPSTAYKRAACLNELLPKRNPAARYRLCKCVTWWHSVMSQSHRIKGGTTDEVFKALQEQCFLWERGAPVGLCRFQEFTWNTEGKKETKWSIICLL